MTGTVSPPIYLITSAGRRPALYLGFAPPAAAGAAATGASAASWAVPAIGAAVLGVQIFLGFLKRRGARRVAATQIVEELEPALARNRDAYMAGPTAEIQQQALRNFDEAWAYLASSRGCGNSDLGGAGDACIRDRDRGGQWDWFAAYRDPIEQTDPPAFSAAAGGLLPTFDQAGAGGLIIPLALIAAGVALL